MPDIQAGYIKSYSSRMEMLLQQEESLLEGCVQIPEMATGKEMMLVEQIGEAVAQEVTQRYQPVVFTTPSHDSRWVRPRDWYVAAPIDKFDLERRLTDPQGMFAQSQSAAMKRRKDDSIISAFFGSALTGEDGTTSVSATTDGVTAIVSGSLGLTVDKMRSGLKQLLLDENSKDEERFIGVTATQHDDLISETQIINLDYNSKPVLVDGQVTYFLGTNIKMCNRFATNVTGERRCPMWVKSGMALQSWNGVETEVQDRPDLVNTKQVKTIASFDATRLQGPKVVEIACDES